MLADEVDYVVGVDTHLDEHVLAVVSASAGAVVARCSVPANARGYAEAVRFVERHANTARVWTVEGAGSNIPCQMGPMAMAAIVDARVGRTLFHGRHVVDSQLPWTDEWQPRTLRPPTTLLPARRCTLWRAVRGVGNLTRVRRDKTARRRSSHSARSSSSAAATSRRTIAATVNPLCRRRVIRPCDWRPLLVRSGEQFVQMGLADEPVSCGHAAPSGSRPLVHRVSAGAAPGRPSPPTRVRIPYGPFYTPLTPQNLA
jgi:hypothetical protein